MTLVEYEHMQWVWFLLSWSLRSGGDVGKGVRNDGILVLGGYVWVSVKECLWAGGGLSVSVCVGMVYLSERAVCVWMVRDG